MLQGNPKYLSDSIKDPETILRKLNRGKLTKSCFLITLANGSEQLEIYPSYVLIQKYYRDLNMEVVGMASSMDDAMAFVGRMAEEAFETTGDCRIKDFLMNN